MKLVLSCEHAFPDIPGKYRYLFDHEPEVLKTHEAYDPGAFHLFQELEQLAEFSKYQSIGRLLVETNRSTFHKNIFSRYSKKLSKLDHTKILESYYTHYRTEIENKIEEFIHSGNTVLHLSVHTFTPVLHEVERNCDIGLLYDPGRYSEKEFCKDWKTAILIENPDLKVRYNYPYLGKADGFTTTLRKNFPENYMGIEIEVNQKWVRGNKMDTNNKNVILKALKRMNPSD
ncbi:N-formylglutamate amidohydrolase [Gramella sp. MAR_2010_147]|uniref:N-formylglutamate amidohydrolase n=1 Tax=Gramella sp. MAR_2010_147 TaxID=1250205 RepID=UPI00087B891A|nr:N-formylglutamate amidohydrolase [Gramella sp. MAR_2010_147]SDR80704.1 Predicted N-formylglutamate amidohydrolase [Gramella sp. MAR_2010_147]